MVNMRKKGTFPVLKTGLFLSLAEMKPPPFSGAITAGLQDQVSQLERELREKTQALQKLTSSEEELRREVAQLQREMNRLKWEA